MTFSRSFASHAGRALLIPLVGLMLLSASALAAPALAPGDVQYNPYHLAAFSFFAPNYVSSALPAQYNTLIASNDFPYNYNGQKDGSFFGFVRSTIWADANGHLAFTYIFNNLTPPPSVLNNFNPNSPLTDIVRATINDPSNPWTGFNILSAGADTSGSSTPINGFFGGWSDGSPFSLQRSATDSGVSFNFNPLNSGTQLNSTPNDVSSLIWIATDATRAGITNVGLSDNGHVGTAQTYAPRVNGDIPTPEPSTFVLSALAALGGAVVWRKRRRTPA